MSLHPKETLLVPYPKKKGSDATAYSLLLLIVAGAAVIVSTLLWPAVCAFVKFLQGYGTP